MEKVLKENCNVINSYLFNIHRTAVLINQEAEALYGFVRYYK